MREKKLKKKAVMKWMLCVMIGTWLIISVYFYFQHRIQVDVYYIGEHIEFDEFSIIVKNIERYNYEKNDRKLPEYIFELQLPWKMTEAILKINYFYSRPYLIHKDAYEYKVNCEVIFNPELIDSESVSEKVRDKIKVRLYNEATTSSRTANQTQSHYNSNMNVIHYAFIGVWQDDSDIKISVQDKDYIISFEEPFLTKTYDYSNRKPDDRNQLANDTIKEFLWDYYNDSIEESKNYIHEDYIEDFPWHIFKAYQPLTNTNYIFSYVGKHRDKEKVFIINVSDIKANDNNQNYKFYMVYEDLKWQIMDAKN